MDSLTVGEVEKLMNQGGGRAFPVKLQISQHLKSGEPVDDMEIVQPGMTLRQWYAGQALQHVVNMRREEVSEIWSEKKWMEIFAKKAFQIADAMIAHEKAEDK